MACESGKLPETMEVSMTEHATPESGDQTVKKNAFPGPGKLP